MACDAKPLMGDKETARAGLNLLLREVVLATQACEHADCFYSTVPVDQVSDYHSFVDPRNATVCLEQILSRARSCFYSSVHEFRREYELLLANALAYNSPGHGRHAHRPVIGWAQALLDMCIAELAARQSDLASFEQRLKESMGTGDSHTSKDSVHASPRSHKNSTAVCPLSSMDALVAACEMAVEQEGLVEDNMLQFYMDVIGNGHGEAAAGDEGMGEHGSGSGSGSQFGVDSDPQLQLRIKREPSGADGCTAPAHTRAKAGSGRNAHSSCDAPPKYRRHKSKVYIRPNKVVYLPTTFMEENFDPASLPVNCEMIVETDGGLQPDRHRVTIKAVPRQGLATMYCMTNVMKFQQQFLNWQILNWTKMDDKHIKIHLQSPNGCSKGKGGESDDGDAAPPAPRNESHKRKGNNRNRDAYDSGAGCTNDDDVGAAMEVDATAGPAVTQAEEPSQQARHSSRGASGTASPRSMRGHGRRTSAAAAAASAKAAAAQEAQQGPGAQADGSGFSSPSHHDSPNADVAIQAVGAAEGSGRGTAVSSGSAEDGQCDRDAGSSGAMAAQASHELQLSPAHSSGNDSGGAVQQSLPTEVAQHAVQQQQQQQHGIGHMMQQQQQQALPLPFPQALAFGPAGLPFPALPLWGLPPPASSVLTSVSGSSPFNEQYQRYAAAMMLLQQLPGAALGPPPPNVMMPGLGLSVAPLRTGPPPSLVNAASLPAGADACTIAHDLCPPMSYKRCKTSSGSSADTATAAGTPQASPAGVLPSSSASVDFSCLSLPALASDSSAMAAMAAAANAAAMARAKLPADLTASQLQHAMTL